MNRHHKYEMATEDKAAFSQWFIENMESLRVFFVKSTWLFISVFAVSTRLAMDRMKGIKVGFIQGVCAFIIGVFIGYLSYHVSIVFSVENENLRIIIVGCCSISFNEISRAVISLKWRKIIERWLRITDDKSGD